ncbi:hypothetical protein [Jannaschia sp. M317]|uniref:hypothetical protein n=1 Tax=Jannaschia sp. M317 TaxID=2867011 RepID=UPI0021A5E84C|nr:hypothetical protein [Jannaschia sp. M317]UWQ17540.1 hypothetical protein K3551_16960 [Jannaschia sp. M317]
MSSQTTLPFDTARAGLLVGLTIASGVALTALLALGPFRTTVDDDLPALTTDISGVEFLSFRSSANLEAALTDACARTGCDADVTLRLVLATTAAMTDEELRDAIASEDRTLAELGHAIGHSPLPETVEVLRSQHAAEAEVLSYLRAQMRAGTTGN